ncbi:hypothetical protein G3I27_11595, partial [Streptomyces sp. SID10692]|nr:hypothetical protein [Streptomyces sp. SID10692]
VPPPEPVRGPSVTAYDVTGAHDPRGAVEVRRRPLVAGHHTRALGFYAVTTEETHPHWPHAAEVLARTVADAEVAALDWIADAASRYENLNVLVARLDETRCLVRLRGGRQLEARTERAWGARRPPLDPVLLGSAVNIRLTDPERSADLADGLTLRTGEWSVRVAFTPPALSGR